MAGSLLIIINGGWSPSTLSIVVYVLLAEKAATNGANVWMGGSLPPSTELTF